MTSKVKDKIDIMLSAKHRDAWWAIYEDIIEPFKVYNRLKKHMLKE